MSRRKMPRAEAIYLAGQIDKLTQLTFQFCDTEFVRSLPREQVPSLLGDIFLVHLWLDAIANEVCSIVTEGA